MSGICMKFIDYIKGLISNNTSFTKSVEDVYELLNHKIIDLNKNFNVGDQLSHVFTDYNDYKEAEIKIREAFEILHGDILDFPGLPRPGPPLRENTRTIFDNFHTNLFGDKPGRIHILHLHGGLENHSTEQDSVFRTQANIIGYVPFGGYGLIRVNEQYQIYEKMCEDFTKGIIPVLAPPMDIRLEHEDSSDHLPPAMALKGLLFPNYIIQTEPIHNSFGITICDGRGNPDRYYSTVEIYDFLTKYGIQIFPHTATHSSRDEGPVKQKDYNPQTQQPFIQIETPEQQKKKFDDGGLTNHDRLNFHLKDYIDNICGENDIVILPFCSEVSPGNDIDNMYNLSTSLYTLSLNMILGDYLHAHLIKAYKGAISIDRNSLYDVSPKTDILKKGLIYGNYLKWENPNEVRTGLKTKLSDTQLRKVAKTISEGFIIQDDFTGHRGVLRRCQTTNQTNSLCSSSSSSNTFGGSKRTKRKSIRKSIRKSKRKSIRKSRKKSRRTKRNNKKKTRRTKKR